MDLPQWLLASAVLPVKPSEPAKKVFGPMSHSLRECILLIPSSGLDDFPEALPGADSAQVLSAWLALWHPRLIAHTHASPRWQSANQPPHSFEGILALAPDCTQTHLPSDLANTATNAGGWLISPKSDWRGLQTEILQTLNLPKFEATLEPNVESTHEPTTEPSYEPTLEQTVESTDQPASESELLPELQSEFAALGYAYLQIQLLTQKLRYTSNLDQLLFDSQVDEAASAALQGDVDQANRLLQSCFDQLGQERDHYYSLDVSLLDVTLLAKTTLGSTVAQQLDRPLPTTFVASASLLRQMQTQQPTIAQQLKQAVSDQRASLAGGLDVERPHPLMNFDSLMRDLMRGQQAYRDLGFAPPTAFTRFSFGQVSDMPLHLRRSGYAGSMLIAWQEGSYPSGSHAKFSWEAAEGTFINAVAPPLVDAMSPTTYLTLGRRIAESLDHQHVPVFMMAHWPNQYSTFFELLERVVRRTPALGRWQHVDDFFEKTDQPYHQDSLPGRKFMHDWAAAAGSKCDELIDATMIYHQLSMQLRQLQNLANLAYQLENFHKRPQAAQATDPGASTGDSAADPNQIGQHVERGPQALALSALDSQLSQLADAVDGLLDEGVFTTAKAAQIRSEVDALLSQLVSRFARAAGHRTSDAASANNSANSAATTLLINPTSAPQRLILASSTDVAPTAGASWLYATGCDPQRRLSMIDLPGFGMLPVAMQPTNAPRARREPTLVQGDGLLVNDFMEIQIDPRSGALRSLHVPGKRGNRFSMQVARRERSGGPAEYSQMQITELRTIENSPVRGCLRAVGNCLLRGERTAAFEIDYELLRGQRVLNVDIKLSNVVALSGSPWSSGYVLRSAWPNESSILTTRSCSSRLAFPSGKAVATEWIEIDDVEYRTYLLTSGMPFHQRVEERFLESLLGLGSAGSLRRRIGIGFDLPNPSVTASQFGQAPLSAPLMTTSSAAPSDPAWLMHVDAKNVILQLESPLVDRSGNCAGLRVHLSELGGKSVTARIRALREVREAHRVDYHGNRIAKLTVEGDTTSIAIRPHEMTFIDLEWA